MALRAQDKRGGRNGQVAQIWCILLLWNERVLVTYFKKMNVLFETDRNGRCMPAVAVRTLQDYLTSCLCAISWHSGKKGYNGTSRAIWFPGALLTPGSPPGISSALSEWHGWHVSKRVAKWRWALFPFKCQAWSGHRLPFFSVEVGRCVQPFICKVTYLFGHRGSYIWSEI